MSIICDFCSLEIMTFSISLSLIPYNRYADFLLETLAGKFFKGKDCPFTYKPFPQSLGTVLGDLFMYITKEMSISYLNTVMLYISPTWISERTLFLP